MHGHTVVRQSEGMPKHNVFLSTNYYFNQSQNNRPAKLLFDWLKVGKAGAGAPENLQINEKSSVNGLDFSKTSKQSGRFFLIFVAFSEYLTFIW